MQQTRNTAQKQLVLRLMENNMAHPTADELYYQARETDPHISRGTVYRILNSLSQAGELRRLSMPYGPDHFDSNMSNHYHFLCRECEKVYDTPLPYNDRLNNTPAQLEGFITEWHRLVLIGLCRDCAQANDNIG